MTTHDQRGLSALSQEEEDVIEALHFLLSFHDLMLETKFQPELLSIILTKLIKNKLVQVFEWNTNTYDYHQIEILPNQFDPYFYLATKEGLFSFHSA